MTLQLNTSIQIGRFAVGLSAKPFVIAEMSGNHNGSLDRALAIVDAAADAGAQALKLQTYTADTMTIDLAEREFVIDDPSSPWHGRSLYDLYQEAHTPWDWHLPIFERARRHGMVAFSTAFDATSVDFLETLEVPCYKIASFENVDLPLIRKVASTGKPLIISTGLATLAEIDQAVAAARGAGCSELILLKCTSAYPASPADSNLRAIGHLREAFGCEVGLSDHTLGIGAAVASVALGATVIEKHVTLRRTDGGVDSAFSLEPQELRQLVEEVERARMALGSVQYGPRPNEVASLRFRRSLYVVSKMAAGETYCRDNVRAIRPGLGLAPKHIDSVLGRRAARDIALGTALSWDLVV
jgi:N-acetylneuraminate synthase